jgi:hypothetical protein
MPQFDSGGIVEKSLRDYFLGLVSEAAKTHNDVFSPQAVHYVTDVLVHFHETARLFVQTGSRVPVMAEMLSHALEADFYRRIVLLRQMGDTSLMVSGFFPEAVTRRSVDLGYYQQMGEIAYSQLGSMSGEPSVFDELSERFRELSGLINDVADVTSQRSTHLLQLVEMYQRTKSEHTLEKLKKQGVIPLNRPKRDPLSEI